MFEAHVERLAANHVVAALRHHDADFVVLFNSYRYFGIPDFGKVALHVACDPASMSSAYVALVATSCCVRDGTAMTAMGALFVGPSHESIFRFGLGLFGSEYRSYDASTKRLSVNESGRVHHNDLCGSRGIFPPTIGQLCRRGLVLHFLEMVTYRFRICG